MIRIRSVQFITTAQANHDPNTQRPKQEEILLTAALQNIKGYISSTHIRVQSTSTQKTQAVSYDATWCLYLIYIQRGFLQVELWPYGEGVWLQVCRLLVQALDQLNS